MVNLLKKLEERCEAKSDNNTDEDTDDASEELVELKKGVEEQKSAKKVNSAIIELYAGRRVTGSDTIDFNR